MADLRQDIEEILRESVWAPSGDNTQPWRFEVRDSEITIINALERDGSLFNRHRHATLMANGALLQNVLLASRAKGYEPQIVLCPDPNNQNVIAHAKLLPGSVEKNDLYAVIKKRSSNRLHYTNRAIPEEMLSMLAREAEPERVVWISDASSRQLVAKAVSADLRLILENKDLHDVLFRQITWTEQEDARRHGFSIKTFGLNPLQFVMFRLFRFWPLMQIFNAFGAARMAARIDSRTFLSAPVFGAIVYNFSSHEDFVRLGMSLQRLWLKATAFGLSFQPMTGIPILFWGNEEQGGEGFSEAHRALIERSYRTLQEQFKAGKDRVGFVFRLGYAPEPKARTTRAVPQITFLP